MNVTEASTRPTELNAAWLDDVKGAGGLSIVLQGGLYDHNIEATANHCRHWRALFPNAQIILSISVTDLLEGAAGEQGEFTDIQLVGSHRRNGAFRAALALLNSACDLVVLSPGATALPPVKRGVGPNNANLQIQAARSGLRHAQGRYILRVRSDLVFLSDRFLSFYRENATTRRGSSAFLEERVLISQLFTLNPYTVERMPFHFSDWFHFGKASDVKKLWPPLEYSFRDSTYFSTRAYAADSNRIERQFLSRIAVEQALATGAMEAAGKQVELEYFNDHRAADHSMRILLDNFVLADMHKCEVYFPKYERSMRDRHMRTLCITPEDWSLLAECSDSADFKEFYADRIRAARWYLILNQEPSMKFIRWVLRVMGRSHRSVRSYFQSVARVTEGVLNRDRPAP